MKRALIALLCAAAASCRADDPPPADPPAVARSRAPKGGCRNADVPAGSRCGFRELSERACPECAAGEISLRVDHDFESGGTTWRFESAEVRIPAGRRAELEAFLRERSPVACSGEIVKPPCNPDATSVELELPWPEWVKR